MSKDTKNAETKQCTIPIVCNCDLKCTNFSNIESLLFAFWSSLKNDVDCVNSENIVAKIKQFCND